MWVFAVLVCIVAILFSCSFSAWIELSWPCIYSHMYWNIIFDFFCNLSRHVFLSLWALVWSLDIMHGEVKEKSSTGAVYSICCKNLAPPTLEILLKFPQPRFSSPNSDAAFFIAGTLPINVVLPIQLGALEPIQFIRVSSSVVYFSGFAHLNWANIFSPSTDKKRGKIKIFLFFFFPSMWVFVRTCGVWALQQYRYS